MCEAITKDVIKWDGLLFSNQPNPHPSQDYMGAYEVLNQMPKHLSL